MDRTTVVGRVSPRGEDPLHLPCISPSAEGSADDNPERFPVCGVLRPLTEQQTQLASGLPPQVQRLTVSEERDDLALLVAMSNSMASFKQLLDSCTAEEMDLLCERYPGFSHFGKVLERVAKDIASGRIPVPNSPSRLFAK